MASGLRRGEGGHSSKKSRYLYQHRREKVGENSLRTESGWTPSIQTETAKKREVSNGFPLRQLTAVLVWTVTATMSVPLTKTLQSPLQMCQKRGAELEEPENQTQTSHNFQICAFTMTLQTALAALAPDSPDLKFIQAGRPCLGQRNPARPPTEGSTYVHLDLIHTCSSINRVLHIIFPVQSNGYHSALPSSQAEVGLCPWVQNIELLFYQRREGEN